MLWGWIKTLQFHSIIPIESACDDDHAISCYAMLPRFRSNQLSTPHPGQFRAPRGDGISSSGAALQSLWSPRTQISLAKGQPATGARHTLQTECDRPTDRESPAQRHRDVCVWGVERLWECWSGWQAACERSVPLGSSYGLIFICTLC